jgi:hypothetical protein
MNVFLNRFLSTSDEYEVLIGPTDGACKVPVTHRFYIEEGLIGLLISLGKAVRLCLITPREMFQYKK